LKSREQLFRLTVAEVSAHDLLTPLFLGCGEAKYHGGRAWWGKVAYIMVSRK
jgi:hypothetical protein